MKVKNKIKSTVNNLDIHVPCNKLMIFFKKKAGYPGSR